MKSNELMEVNNKLFNLESMMNDNIMAVTQLPIIEQQLQLIEPEINKYINEAVELAKNCTEGNYKELKKSRAKLNSCFSWFEEHRKIIKNAIMEPYKKFDDTYKECVARPFTTADTIFKGKISYVTDGMVEEKRDEVARYFNEYAKSSDIDFLKFERSGIKVNLSSSIKSLKDESKKFIDKVSDELGLIEKQEHSSEIRIEYEKTLNLPQAVNTVTERHRALEKESKRKEEAEKSKSVKAVAIQKMNEVIAKAKAENSPIVSAEVQHPKRVVEVEREYTTSFRVTASLAKLKVLKEFLENGGYKYEC